MTLKQLTHSACDESGATKAFARRLLDLIGEYGDEMENLGYHQKDARDRREQYRAAAEEKLKEIAAALDTAAPDA